MSKAYPSNLTRLEYEFLSDLIPEPKLGGRPTVEIWAILNAIFCAGRGLPLAVTTGDFPAWQTVYTSDRNWRKDGTWISIHDRLREWTRIEQDRHPSPSESIIDSQSVKSAAGVSQQVGFDSGKLIKGRKRFLSVDTWVWCCECSSLLPVFQSEGGKRVLRRVKRMDKSLCRLTTIWVDGGFGAPF